MQKETGTKEQTNTDTLDHPYDLFSRALRQSTKWRPNAHQLIKRKNRYKKEEDVETRRIRQKSSFIGNIANRDKKYEGLD